MNYKLSFTIVIKMILTFAFLVFPPAYANSDSLPLKKKTFAVVPGGNPEVNASFVKQPIKHGDRANIRLSAYAKNHKMKHITLIIKKADQSKPFYTYETKKLSDGVFLETLRLDRFPRGHYKMIAIAEDVTGAKGSKTVSFSIQ